MLLSRNRDIYQKKPTIRHYSINGTEVNERRRQKPDEKTKREGIGRFSATLLERIRQLARPKTAVASGPGRHPSRPVRVFPLPPPEPQIWWPKLKRIELSRPTAVSYAQPPKAEKKSETRLVVFPPAKKAAARRKYVTRTRNSAPGEQKNAGRKGQRERIQKPGRETENTKAEEKTEKEPPKENTNRKSFVRFEEEEKTIMKFLGRKDSFIELQKRPVFMDHRFDYRDEEERRNRSEEEIEFLERLSYKLVSRVIDMCRQMVGWKKSVGTSFSIENPVQI
ncbi:uncharacterized protein LOC111635491 isoform X1 [Centruroides sculpturatus]|uniref:uncharacterized protein LOC111635491 isoform X1 n=1 Tax=Centruroides sculpturatus TaxID=218467 RepID=UPI000C6CE7D4|nr:uncharacterized protein LOC111635491 isoform X1 [Centruroides sculpturatus]